MRYIDFLDVGFGDATVIRSTSGTIIIDCHEIESYRSILPSLGKIKAVFITHQHADHYDGLEFLINNFQIEYLIFSPYERRYNDSSVASEDWNYFNSLIEKSRNKGTKIYQPYRQDSFEKPWWEPFDDIKIWMIGPIKSIATSTDRVLHDACLVFRFDIGTRHCCFTGDASDKSLDYIASITHDYCNDILHASHHGSIEGASLDFIKKANLKTVIISTKQGVHESIPHDTALQRYRSYSSDVHRTDISGIKTIEIY